jgi:predicted Zn-dependent protease
MKLTIQILRVAVLSMLMGSAGADINRIELPDLGDPAESALSISKEREIGLEIMQQIRQQHVTVDDLIVYEYINSIGHQLVSNADSALHDFSFFVIRDNSINAFALPGGYIGVNAGLISTTEDESELAAVLAHEISHVTQRHIARAFFHNETMQAPLIAAMIAGILMGGEAAKAAVAAATAGSAQSQINFTRKNEYEADRVGIDLLGRSGYDAYSMASLFDKMHRQSRLYGGAPPEFLSTHPVHGSRIADARARAGKYPPSQRSNSEQYRIVRARLRVIMDGNPTKVANDLSRMLEEKRSADEVADRYALVFALMEAGKLQEAMLESDRIINKPQLATYIQLQRAELELRSGQDDKAELRMEQLKRTRPDNHVVVMEDARMKIQMGHASQARALLEDYLDFRQGDPNVYRLLSHASNASGDIVKSHTYMAEYNLIVGDVSGAIGHLEAALRNPITSYHEEAAIRAKLKSLRQQSDKPVYGESGKSKI